jgi:hypothetical protein
MAKPPHKRINRSTASGLRCKLFEPLTESGIQSFVLRLGNQASLFDQCFVGA